MLILSLISCLGSKQLGALEAQVQANTERIRILEEQAKNKPNAPRAYSEKDEQNARELYRQVQTALDINDVKKAKSLLSELEPLPKEYLLFLI